MSEDFASTPGTVAGKGAQAPKTKQLELSHEEVRSLLQQTISGGNSYGGGYVRDVYPSHFVHSDGNGNLFDRDYSIGSDSSVTLGLPKKVKQKTGYEPVKMAAFSIDPSDDDSTNDGWVIRTGKIFEAGDYEDKAFSLTPDEMMEAIKDFNPVNIDVEHRPSVFDGKLGQLFHIAVGDNPTDMVGAIKIPSWLDSILGAEALKVSTTWTREPNKRIAGLAATIDPRVPDAAMLTAFAHSGSSTKPVQTEKKRMETNKKSIMDRLKGLFDDMSPEEIAATFSGETDEGDTTKAPFARVQRVQDAPAIDESRVKALETELATFKADKRRKDAADYVNAAIQSRRLLPSQRALFTAKLARAFEDDARDNTLVSFSKNDGTQAQMSRADAEKLSIASNPQHSLFTDHTIKEVLEENEDVALLSGETKPQTERDTFKEGYEFAQKFLSENSPNMGNANMNG